MIIKTVYYNYFPSFLQVRIFSIDYWLKIIKVQFFWEGHKNVRNLPYGFEICWVKVKTMRTIAQIFVAFSEKLNFTTKGARQSYVMLNLTFFAKRNKNQKLWLIISWIGISILFFGQTYRKKELQWNMWRKYFVLWGLIVPLMFETCLSQEGNFSLDSPRGSKLFKRISK